MSEPRKPIFGFLWAQPDPDAPVDERYRQVRRVRVSPRGPIRLTALLLGTAVAALGTGTMVMAAATLPLSPLTLIGSAMVATALAFILRGWVVGTYLTDDGIIIERTVSRTTLAWGVVRAITVETDRCPFLGLPIPVRSLRATVIHTDGHSVTTHVYGTSPDYWLRQEAFDAARLRLDRWAQAE